MPIAIPAIVILDITRESRIKYVRKWANKFGIINYVDVKYEIIEK
ncbi:MAG: hypothetical protein ACTSQJ_08225 [Promethearchaeota archaeon]